MRLIYWLTRPYYVWHWRRHKRVVCIASGCWRFSEYGELYCKRHV